MNSYSPTGLHKAVLKIVYHLLVMDENPSFPLVKLLADTNAEDPTAAAEYRYCYPYGHEDVRPRDDRDLGARQCPINIPSETRSQYQAACESQSTQEPNYDTSLFLYADLSYRRDGDTFQPPGFLL